MPLLTLSTNAYGNTDPGKVRSRNEDAFLIDTKYNVFAVADGLGGLPEGQLASSLTIEGLKQAISKHQLGDSLNFQKIFSNINMTVYKRGQLIDSQTGIGSTLTAIQILNNQLSVGHIGDSGLFLLRNHQLIKLTKDHTVAQDLYDKLTEDKKNTTIPEHLFHMLTRCIGIKHVLTIDGDKYTLYGGDRLLLYTDGITKTLSNEEIESIMIKSRSPQIIVDELINLSLERSVLDNVTAIAIIIS